MKEKEDLTGRQFGWLTVIGEAPKRNGNRARRWFCRCKCGTIKDIRGADLKSGKIVSCKCYHKQDASNRFRITGMSQTNIQRVYKMMKHRCNNPNDKEYKNYGGRGIKVCGEWNRRYGFKAFYEWAINNGYKEGLTLERKDTNGNYEPSNCTWIPSRKQASNKTNNVFITYKGITHTLSQWGRISHIDNHKIKKFYIEDRIDELFGELTQEELLSNDEILYPSKKRVNE